MQAKHHSWLSMLCDTWIVIESYQFMQKESLIKFTWNCLKADYLDFNFCLYFKSNVQYTVNIKTVIIILKKHTVGRLPSCTDIHLRYFKKLMNFGSTQKNYNSATLTSRYCRSSTLPHFIYQLIIFTRSYALTAQNDIELPMISKSRRENVCRQWEDFEAEHHQC